MLKTQPIALIYEFSFGMKYNFFQMSKVVWNSDGVSWGSYSFLCLSLCDSSEEYPISWSGWPIRLIFSTGWLGFINLAQEERQTVNLQQL